jgi:Ni,Fe-hydrogenase maturation factor
MSRRILVAGIGNVFLGDDGFGVEVVRRLASHGLPEGVEVVDFGIRGERPGTVYLIEPEIEEDGEVVLDTHGMDPVKVIKLSRALGARPTRTLVVGCEPQVVVSGEDYEDMIMELSEPVCAAVEEAVKLVESLIEEINKEVKS